MNNQDLNNIAHFEELLRRQELAELDPTAEKLTEQEKEILSEYLQMKKELQDLNRRIKKYEDVRGFTIIDSKRFKLEIKRVYVNTIIVYAINKKLNSVYEIKVNKIKVSGDFFINLNSGKFNLFTAFIPSDKKQKHLLKGYIYDNQEIYAILCEQVDNPGIAFTCKQRAYKILKNLENIEPWAVALLEKIELMHALKTGQVDKIKKTATRL